jgi:hypothetical protein
MFNIEHKEKFYRYNYCIDIQECYYSSFFFFFKIEVGTQRARGGRGVGRG